MFTIITVSLMTSVTGPIAHASGSEAFGIIVAVAIAAAISTAAVWTASQNSGSISDRTARLKAKRRAPRRVEDLLDSLDDQEIYELESLLLAREDPAQQRKP
ncbi:MAG: hypothetical protein AAGU78_12895 [Chloroflexota bacterium]|nr:hypothetical protein [Anaerolineae bacterium]HMM27824.1 hypothetical protein [Aggregatilineaceae bacterium]